MAFYQAELPVNADQNCIHLVLTGHLQALGLEVHPQAKGSIGLVATEPRSSRISCREHVIVHCHWCDHLPNGVVQIECRSDESMARRQTHCRQVFEALCLQLVASAAGQHPQAA